jgi:hypothetical protein
MKSHAKEKVMKSTVLIVASGSGCFTKRYAALCVVHRINVEEESIMLLERVCEKCTRSGMSIKPGRRCPPSFDNVAYMEESVCSRQRRVVLCVACQSIAHGSTKIQGGC